MESQPGDAGFPAMTGNAFASPGNAPLIAHIVFRFDYGGLENGVVNLINRMPDNEFRHCVIALTEASDFQMRIRKAGITVHCLDKRPGKDLKVYLRLFRLIRQLKPAIVHTRNLGTLECLVVAWLAGVPVRIHGEHGWDIYDPDGSNRKYRLLRRFMAPFIDRFVAVSDELAEWLVKRIKISETRIVRICNGVDTEKFHPRERVDREGLPAEIFPPDCVIVGSVTRFSAIKDPINLVSSFIYLCYNHEQSMNYSRLLMIGGGELFAEAQNLVRDAALQHRAWLSGSRDDIPEMLRKMDVFVLGSLREGISNTILEAMASGLPVIASATGGNLELIADGETGRLVPSSDPKAMADAISAYISDADTRERHGRKARERACSRFSLSVMVDSYRRLYRDALQRAGV